jgi:hypothetical protein
MKKITLILIISAFYMSMSSVEVSAGENGLNTINGNYKMIASGSCIHSPSGFVETTDGLGNPLYVPINSVGVWGATTSTKGTWEFYSDGTGHADIWNYPIDFPPGSNIGGPRARSQKFVFDVEYEVIKDVIIIDLYLHTDPPSFVQNVGHLEGSVSIDKKTLIIPTHLQKIEFGGPPLYSAVCNTMRVFTRVGKID